MNRFEYTDEHDQRLRIAPVEREQPNEEPALWFETTDGGFRGTSVKVPLSKLEEVIAGGRDMARQAVPLPGARITDEQLATAQAVLSPGAVVTAAAVLSTAERQFLTFALDLAFDRMVSEDGFTSEDEAVLARLRQLAKEA
ncbi:hypothetical protein J7F03_20650 [Streptomyces sp. ISL-43]|uniref:hypothetical protein n=1 Tax=Streptomyces sp. ISL-43 TaxID=2819183 RepID=UPI001BECAAC9|nr:hypothetical protein [Streptomyces sp. ISL-43]MBT2449454.1 hypothetical protein [Streptomyces sp. ISL-43]